MIAVLIRANQNGDDLFYKALKVFNGNTGFFLPKVVARQASLEEITAFIRKITGNYLLGEFSRAWKYNAEVLGEKFSWDPVNIFRDMKSHSEARALLVYSFRGVGEKIAALIIEWFEEIEALPYPLYGAPPLDFHVLRFLLITSIVEIEELISGERIRGDKIIKVVLPLFDEFCREEKLTSSHIDPALWLWSRHACTSQKRCYWCPEKDLCRWFFRYGTYKSKEGVLFEEREDKQLYLLDEKGRPKF